MAHSDSDFHGPGRVKSTAANAALAAPVGLAAGATAAGVSIGRNDAVKKTISALAEPAAYTVNAGHSGVMDVATKALRAENPTIASDIRTAFSRAGKIGLGVAIAIPAAAAVEGYYHAAKGQRQFRDMVGQRDALAKKSEVLEAELRESRGFVERLSAQSATAEKGVG